MLLSRLLRLVLVAAVAGVLLVIARVIMASRARFVVFAPAAMIQWKAMIGECRTAPRLRAVA